MMIKNLVFDFGRVLIDFEPAYITGQFITDKQDIALLEAELFGGPEWPSLDDGSACEEEIAVSICERLPTRLHGAVRQVLGGWFWHLPVRAEMPPLIEELKALGYSLYLLSNISRRFRDCESSYEFFRLFRGTFVSAEHKLVKPDRAIYERFLDTCSLAAEECFFIDDKPENIAAAHACGMQGFVYQGDILPLRQALRQAGILVKER